MDARAIAGGALLVCSVIVMLVFFVKQKGAIF